MNDVIAPEAPGRLGEAVDPALMFNYLDQLGAWLTGRRAQLDELDQAAQRSQHAAELTADMALSMSLWQTIKTRYGNLLQVWDSGRVGPKEAEQLSALVWGRLEAPGGAGEAGQVPGMSAPEACKLSDALTNQLRVRLQIDPSGSQAIARLSILRENLERLRDQVALEPLESVSQARTYLAQLTNRVREASEKAGRGGDVGGLLGPLEIETATFERDLIVDGAVRRQNREQHEAVARRRDVATSRGRRLNDLVAEVVAAVAEPPKYAVPNVAGLGPVPADKAGLDAFAAKLDRVEAAMDFVEKAYTDALQLATQPAPAPEPEPEPEQFEALPDQQPAAATKAEQQTPPQPLSAPLEASAVVSELAVLDPLQVILDDLERQQVDDELLAGLIATAARLVGMQPQPTRAAEAALMSARAYRDWLADHPNPRATP